MTDRPDDPFEDEATLPDEAPRKASKAALDPQVTSTIERWSGWIGDSVEELDTERSLALHAPELESTELGPEEFETEEAIAEGGSGIIYRARQRSLDRIVALKKSKPGPRRRQAAFVAEARLTGTLEHPNIVPVYGLGRDRDREPYLAMKLVEGRSWREALRAGELESEKSLRILLSVCAALRYAHERKGIIHRDIKPGNVMLGEYGEVLVMDWGLALTLERVRQLKEDHAREPLTPIKPAGTPAYMAPEMVEGRVWDFGPWTDVFLLGAVLHELLAGAPPYRHSDFWIGLSLAASCEAQDYDEEAPAELVALARKAMAKDIDQRLSSVREFERGLEDYLTHREAAALAQRGAALFEEGRKNWDLRSLGRGLTYYEQSLELWPEQEELRQRLYKSRATMGHIGLERGDLALARLVSRGIPEGHPLRLALEESIARTERRLRRRQRRYRFAQAAAVALALVVIIGAILTQSLLARARSQEQRRRVEELLTAAAGSAALAREKLEAIPELEGAVRRLEEASRRAPWAVLDHPSKRALQEARGRLSAAIEVEERARAQALFELSAADSLSRAGWPELADEAREAIARILESRILAAEARRDPAARRTLIAELRARCGAEHPAVRALAAARGVLAIDSKPSGAAVALFRFETAASGRLEPKAVLEAQGLVTPLELALPPGSYLARLSAPGKADLAYPFVIERDRTWPRDFLSDPGRDALDFEAEELRERCRVLRLYEPETIGEGFVQVPAGPFLRGEPGRWSVLPYDFFVARFEVSVGEYQAGLQRLPRELRGAEREDPTANPYERDQAAVALSWIEAARHCRWLPRQEGCGPARLLSDAEWEKAARGVDGRRFPWGQAFDFSLAHGGLSLRGGAARRERGAFAADVSVYGIRDLAGGVQEWTGYHPEGALVESVDPVTGATARVALRQRGLSFSRLGGRAELRRVRGGDWRAAEARLFEAHRGVAAPAGEASPRRGFRVLRLPRDEAERRRRFARGALRRRLPAKLAGLRLLEGLEKLQDARDEDIAEPGARLLTLASLYRRLGDSDRALESALGAVELFERRLTGASEALVGLRGALLQLHAMALVRRDLDAADGLARRILELGEKLDAVLPRALADRFRDNDGIRLAETALARGDGPGALAALDRIPEHHAAYGGRPWRLLRAARRTMRAQALQLIGRVDEAEREIKAALAVYETRPGAAPLEHTFALEVAVRVVRDGDRFKEALTLAGRAAAITSGLLEAEGDAPIPLSNHARSLERLADLHHGLERFDEALRCSREALELRRRVIALTGETPGSCDAMALSLEIAAGLHIDGGRPREALELGRSSIALREDLYEASNRSPDNALDLAVGLSQLARLYDDAGDNDRALAVGARGVALARRALAGLEPSPIRVSRAAAVISNQADSLNQAGREREALAMTDEAYRLYTGLLARQASPETVRDAIHMLQRKARLLMELDDPAGGESAAGEARRLAESLDPELLDRSAASSLGVTLFILARLRERADRRDEALRFLEQADALFVKAEARGAASARRRRITALVMVSRLLLLGEREAEGLKQARRARGLADGLDDSVESRRHRAYALYSEGRALIAVNEVEAALRALAEAEEAYGAVRGELGDRPELWEELGATAFQRAKAERRRGQAEAAEAAIRRAVAAFRDALKRREARRRPARSLARALEELADLRSAAGDAEEAAEALGEAVTLLRGLVKDGEAPEGRLIHALAITSSKLSEVQKALGRSAEALLSARAAVDDARLARSLLPAWDQTLVNLHYNLQSLRQLLVAKHRAEALILSEEILALTRSWPAEGPAPALQARRQRRLAVALGMVAELKAGEERFALGREGLAASRRAQDLRATEQGAALVQAFERLLAGE